MVDFRQGKALIAQAFHQQFSEIDNLTLTDYRFFVEQAQQVVTHS